MKKTVILILAALILLLAGCSGKGQVMDGPGMVNSYHQISQEEAAKMMEQDDGHVIVDVRRQDEYDAGHIPGAILIPNESINAEPPAELPDKNQIILIYCRSGNRSKQAAEKLFRMGYRNIYEFGGINTWTGEIVTAEPAAESEPQEKQDVQESDNTENGSDILVVYFSRTGEQYGVGVIDEGNTAIVAQMIAEQTGAHTFEILPVDDHYPMTYSELTDVAKQEQNENARPAYESGVSDLSQYSTIFIGAPVWWGDWPMICYTFFENENLSGKTLYPFSTHAGSGLSGFDRKLASAVPDATVGEGLAIAGTDCQSDRDGVKSKVNDWLSGLGF